MKKTKSEKLYEYVIQQKHKIDIEKIFKDFNINKVQFNRLKFKIKENYSESEYLNFLKSINGPKLLLLKNQIYVDIPNFMINKRVDKNFVMDYFNMTSNEFTSMMQNLKKHDVEKYNKVLLLCKKTKKKTEVKCNNNDFSKITNFIIENNCGYYEVCKNLKINDSNIVTILNLNKEKYPQIVKNVKQILKSNKDSDKNKFNDISIFQEKNILLLLKYLIIKKGYTISDVSLYFLVRYNTMNKFIKKDLKCMDEKIYFEINQYLNSYKKYIKVIEYCIKNEVDFKEACNVLHISEKTFMKNLQYLKHTKQYKQMRKEAI